MVLNKAKKGAGGSVIRRLSKDQKNRRTLLRELARQRGGLPGLRLKGKVVRGGGGEWFVDRQDQLHLVGRKYSSKAVGKSGRSWKKISSSEALERIGKRQDLKARLP